MDAQTRGLKIKLSLGSPATYFVQISYIIKMEELKKMYCHLKFQKQLQISRNVLVHANQKDVRWNKNWKIANNQLLISKCV